MSSHPQAAPSVEQLRARARPPGPARGGLKQIGFYLDPLHFLARLQRTYGDLVAFRFLQHDAILISDPELIREILVTQHANFIKGPALQRSRAFLGDGLLTNEGAAHLRQRKLMQPAFYHDRLRTYGATMVELTACQMERWRQRDLSKKAFDMRGEMVALTQAIVARTLYSADLSSESEPLTQAISDLFGFFRLLRLPGGRNIGKFPILGSRLRKAEKKLDGLMYKLIAERRASQADCGDLLSMLLLKDADGDGMNDKQIRDEMLTLFIAGHETTANALAWTWKLLAQNPEAERQFHHELMQLLNGRLPNFDDLDRLPYTRAVLAESMRLYPPAWLVARQAKGAFRLGSYRFGAGTVCMMSQWIVHRHPLYWSEPDRFLPERWLAEGDRPKLAYFPFGAGPRVCIGERFAWMEGVLVLAAIGSQWQFQMRKPEAEPGLEPSITLRPKGGLPMVACQR
ncbi:MAG TPA: cytochrome P450 [Bryobacteraceae bacterium]|jgi:cytochrome P450|nr:cytochrome P450 [Bryobacteraceae bacterium]